MLGRLIAGTAIFLLPFVSPGRGEAFLAPDSAGIVAYYQRVCPNEDWSVDLLSITYEVLARQTGKAVEAIRKDAEVEAAALAEASDEASQRAFCEGARPRLKQSYALMKANTPQ